MQRQCVKSRRSHQSWYSWKAKRELRLQIRPSRKHSQTNARVNSRCKCSGCENTMNIQNTSLYIIHISTDETGKIRLVSCVGWCSCLRRITVDLNTETHTSAAASHWNIASWASMSNQHQGTCSLQSFPYNIKPAKNMMYISKAVGASGNRDCNDGSANCITRAIGHQRLKRDAKGCRECWPTAGVFALSTQILWTSTLIDSCMLRLRPPD